MFDDPEENPHPNPLPAMPGEGTETDRDDRLAAIVSAYSADLEAGRRPDRRALIRQNPDLADDLSACLGGLNFLQSAANQLAAASADMGDVTAGGPQPLGDYRLLREIGRGGMGIVYEAEQLSLARRVAVKVLPLAAAMDERQLQRFRNEAAAAAQLHHTNIVPVYAVGHERSMHFYAMQLIDGQSLADVIRDLRAGTTEKSDYFASSTDLSFSAPSLTLSTLRGTKRSGFYETVARLGLQAAEALNHAHHAGIVHRDIKPANLLLDGQGNLWVTDFGLAQFYAADNNLTQSSDRPGTLRYMSPEQASGRAVVLDQRTDIYSLGVTLYELLTLERAVPGDTREQLMHNLSDGSLKSARSIDGQIPKELDTILATAAAKDPLDRYATAGALAEDLRRFLNDRPILAKPPGLTQLTMRWLRRHRGIAWASILTMLLLTTGFAVATVRVTIEKARADRALANEQSRRNEAETQRRVAQQNYAEARDAVNFFTDIATNEMSDDRPSPEIRRWMLEAANDYYEKFLKAHRNDPAANRDLSQAQESVGKLLTELCGGVERAFRLRTLLRLLDNSAVAADLKLSPEQSTRVRQLAVKLNGDRGDRNEGPHDGPRDGPHDGSLFGPDTPERRKHLADLGEQTDHDLKDLLSASQADRLNQIARQVRGPGAFADAEVTAPLLLTGLQKEALRRVLTDYRSATRRPPPWPGEDGYDSPATRMADLRERTMAAILAILDPYQTDAWTKTLGQPFPNAERLDQDGPFRHRRGWFGMGPRGFNDHGPNDHGPDPHGPNDGPPDGTGFW